ncbi:MAG TPA: MBL fold metallo-hydrolase [Pyrinomonadaceae bacterium]|jgi:L-ascorbate metabolism protein UlaG (beta-lactamase superfamily)
MSEKTYRLGQSTVVEPLVNNWAVWADLISPVTYSLHLSNYQLKALGSYLANPELHVKANRNPKFIGGPFVDIAPERAEEVRAFMSETERSQSANLSLARAVNECYELLNREGKGQSLEPHYQKLPAELGGYAELLYDYYGHPILRLLEGLLYESPYYNQDLQTLRMFEQTTDASRPFFLSTPRLPRPNEVEWRVPFKSEQIGELFKLESAPQPVGRICELLGLDANGMERLMPLLTDEPHASHAPPRAATDEPRVRYFGHACVLVEWNGVSVLTDPWIGLRSTAGGAERFSFEDLPEKIDFAVITHGHHDHFVPETLLRLRHRIECLIVPRNFGLFYTDPNLKLAAGKLGFKHVVEMDSLDSIKLPGGEIIAVPFFGEHADLAHCKSGYVIRAGRRQILFAADSNCLDMRMYEHLRRTLGPIETVFLGMECVGAPLSWMYGALLPTKLPHQLDQTRRTKGSDSKAALQMLEAVGAKRVFVYAMGNEPWLQFGMGLGLPEDSVQVREANRLLALARERGFEDAQRPFCKFETYL